MKNIFKPTPDSSKTICLLLLFLLSFVQQSYAQRITRYGHENEMYNVGVELKEVECL